MCFRDVTSANCVRSASEPRRVWGQVLKVPEELQYGGRGPLLSARLVDLDLLWGRAEQLLAACTAGKETLRVTFHDINEGGLISRLLGLQLFLPLSQLQKDPAVRKSVQVSHPDALPDLLRGRRKGLLIVQHSWLLHLLQEIKKELCGEALEVAVTEVDPFRRRFNCSQRAAISNKRLANIKCALLSTLSNGRVVRLEELLLRKVALSSDCARHPGSAAWSRAWCGAWSPSAPSWGWTGRAASVGCCTSPTCHDREWTTSRCAPSNLLLALKGNSTSFYSTSLTTSTLPAGLRCGKSCE